MTELATSIILLVGISVACAVVAHALIQRLWVAAAIAAPVSSVLVLMVEALHLGHMDPFAPFAFVPVAALAFGVAVAIGLPFQWSRRHDERPLVGVEQDQP